MFIKWKIYFDFLLQLITVGIGITHSYDKMELEGIASDPDEKTIFYTKNFTTLGFQNNIADNIVRAICSGENLLFFWLLQYSSKIHLRKIE